MRKLDGLWKMTVDYGELGGVVSPIYSTVPNVALWMKQSIKVMRSFHAVLDLANIAVISNLSVVQDQLTLAWSRQWGAFRDHAGLLYSVSF